METWEYLEFRIYPDEHFYTRQFISRRKPNSFFEGPDVIYYPPHLDLRKIDVGKIATAQGWEVVAQAPNQGYLFKRRLNGEPTAGQQAGEPAQFAALVTGANRSVALQRAP